MRQYYLNIDYKGDIILHSGRKGMKWGQHIFTQDDVSNALLERIERGDTKSDDIADKRSRDAYNKYHNSTIVKERQKASSEYFNAKLHHDTMPKYKVFSKKKMTRKLDVAKKKLDDIENTSEYRQATKRFEDTMANVSNYRINEATKYVANVLKVSPHNKTLRAMVKEEYAPW